MEEKGLKLVNGMHHSLQHRAEMGQGAKFLFGGGVNCRVTARRGGGG